MKVKANIMRNKCFEKLNHGLFGKAAILGRGNLHEQIRGQPQMARQKPNEISKNCLPQEKPINAYPVQLR